MICIHPGRWAALPIAALMAFAAPTAAEEKSAAPGETAPTFEEPPAHGEPMVPLSGDEIYQKVLDNRFNSYEQELKMESGDRGGNTDRVEMVDFGTGTDAYKRDWMEANRPRYRRAA